MGAIPARRIVGARRLTHTLGPLPTGPIYMRRTFRVQEPKAFQKVCDILSGKGR